MTQEHSSGGGGPTGPGVWRSIETAPMHESILVCVTYSLPGGEWETVMWVDWQCNMYGWPIYSERADIPFPPTHWMPLPSAPNHVWP